jgi:hypothetical protein
MSWKITKPYKYNFSLKNIYPNTNHINYYYLKIKHIFIIISLDLELQFIITEHYNYYQLTK